jgi:ankyrin repeat protein
VDAKQVSAHRALSLERVSAAPPPSIPSPLLLLLPPTASLVGWADPQEDSCTPLYLASQNGHEATVETLLAAKAQVDQVCLRPPRAPPPAGPGGAAPPPPPPPLALPAADGFSRGVGFSAGERNDPSHRRLSERARGDRQDAPRRRGASGRQDGEHPPRPQPRARPGRAAHPPCPSPLLLLPPPTAPLVGWADPQADRGTPLHAASQNGHEATVETLLAAKAQVDAKMVSAHCAPSLERVPAAPPLSATPPPCSSCPDGSSHGWADPQDTGATPLYLASQFGHEATIKTLLAANAQVDAKETGATPLFIASQEGHEATVKTLLGAKAQVDSKEVSAHRAPSLDDASPCRCPPSSRPPPPPLLFLPPTGSLVGWASPQADGRTPLWTASANGHEATVKTLLAANAHVDAKRVSAHRAPRAQPRARPGRAAPPLSLPPPPTPPCSSCHRRVLSWGGLIRPGGRIDPSLHSTA